MMTETPKEAAARENNEAVFAKLFKPSDDPALEAAMADAVDSADGITTRVHSDPYRQQAGRTPLEAAMRAFVHFKLGDVVDLPLSLRYP